jgi:hypothetical protein
VLADLSELGVGHSRGSTMAFCAVSCLQIPFMVLEPLLSDGSGRVESDDSAPRPTQ